MIRTVVVNQQRAAHRIHHAAVGRGAPASERIARIDKVDVRRIRSGDHRVVVHVEALNSAVAHVGVEHDGRRRRLFAPDRSHGDIRRGHLHLVLGLISPAVSTGLPAEERLAVRADQVAAGENLRVAVLRIEPLIQRQIARAAVGDIAHGELVGADVIAVQRVVLIDRRVEVEHAEAAVCILGGPADPLVAVGSVLRRQLALVDLLAIGHLDHSGFAGAVGIQIDGDGVDVGAPLGIDDQIAGGHGRIAPVKRLNALLGGVPALEAVAVRQLRGTILRSQRDVLVGNGCAELDGVGRVGGVEIVQRQRVAVALVIQEYVALGGAQDRSLQDCMLDADRGHAGDRLCIPVATRAVRILGVGRAPVIVRAVVQDSLIAVCRAGLIQALKHVIEVVQAVRAIICRRGLSVCRAKIRRHGETLGNQFAGNPGDVPAVEAVAGFKIAGGRPEVLDFSLELGRQRILCSIPAALIGRPVDRHRLVAISSQIESDGIGIAAEVHIHDGGTVAGNGDRLQLCGGLCRIIREICAIGQIARRRNGGRELGLRIGGAHRAALVLACEGVVLVVRILGPVVDGEGRFRVRRPVRHQQNARIQLAAEAEGGTVRRPACEGIAGLRGIGGSDGFAAGLDKLGRNVAAAQGVEGDPAARLDLRIEGDVRAADGDAADLVGQRSIGVPAGDGLLNAHREADVGGNHRAVQALAGRIDAALVVQEEHIVHLLEGRFHGHGLRIGHGLHAEAAEGGAADMPADELVALLLGGSGRIQRIARLDHLGADDHAVDHKLINLQHRHRIGGRNDVRGIRAVVSDFGLFFVDGRGRAVRTIHVRIVIAGIVRICRHSITDIGRFCAVICRNTVIGAFGVRCDDCNAVVVRFAFFCHGLRTCKTRQTAQRQANRHEHCQDFSGFQQS